MNKKQLYAAPATEVLELSTEYSVLTVTSKEIPYSGDGEDW